MTKEQVPFVIVDGYDSEKFLLEVIDLAKEGYTVRTGTVQLFRATKQVCMDRPTGSVDETATTPQDTGGSDVSEPLDEGPELTLDEMGKEDEKFVDWADKADLDTVNDFEDKTLLLEWAEAKGAKGLSKKLGLAKLKKAVILELKL